MVKTKHWFYLLKSILSILLLTFCGYIVQAQSHIHQDGNSPKEVNLEYPGTTTLQTIVEGSDPDEVLELYKLASKELKISENTARHELEGIEAKIEAKNKGSTQPESNQLIQSQSLEDLQKRKTELEKQIANIEKHINPRSNKKE